MKNNFVHLQNENKNKIQNMIFLTRFQMNEQF